MLRFRQLILAFLFLFSLAAQASDCFLLLAHIERTQHGLRHGDEFIRRLRLYVRRYGSLKDPLQLVIFEDGRIFVHDGHHRFEALEREQLAGLRAGTDYILKSYRYAYYLAINHAEDWVTPFDPRTHLRLSEFRGFRELVHQFRSRWPEEDLNNFIRSHPEAYSLPRPAKGVDELLARGRFEGSERDRIAYFRKMNDSMPMKVGSFIGAFPTRGILWEPGTGSGAQAYGYAANYPDLLVVGTDLDIQSIRHAQSNFALPNLVYLKGDALAPDFPASSVDAVEDSSTGHHLVSYGKTGADFKEANIERYRRQVVSALKPGGHYAMRDFVTPDWPERVLLTLSAQPGTGSGYAGYSKVRLFEDFADRFRSHDYPAGAKIVRRKNTKTRVTFEAPGEFVANFLLRINYTTNWDAEMMEQYTYYTLREHVESLQRHGLRVDFAQPVQNAWIERNWWSEKIAQVHTLDGQRLDLPPTNLILAARKPRPFEIKELRITDVQPVADKSWLKLRRYREVGKSQEFDLIRVPGRTQTFIPFESGPDGNFIFLNTDVELPSLVFYRQLTQLDRTEYSGILASSFSKVFSSSGPSVTDDFAQVLQEKGLTTLDLQSRGRIELTHAGDVMPSPGTSDELVSTIFVNMNGHGQNNVFSEGQSLRVEVNQLISATNVGSIPNGRLQMAAYQLAIKNHWPLTPWFSGDFTPTDRGSGAARVVSEVAQITAGLPRLSWRELRGGPLKSNYLSLETLSYDRILEDGKVIAAKMEYGRPTHRSVNTVSALPYFVTDGELYIGFETYTMPSFHLHGLADAQTVVPAFRLSNEVTNRHELLRETSAHLSQNFDIHGSLQSLGEGYFPSPGQTPEKVLPYAIEVDVSKASDRVVYVPWTSLQNDLSLIIDLHTRVIIYRLAHALGKIK